MALWTSKMSGSPANSIPTSARMGIRRSPNPCSSRPVTNPDALHAWESFSPGLVDGGLVAQPRRRVGVVRRQVDGRVLGTVGQDRLQGPDVRLWVRADCVGAPRMELLERVADVTGKHHVSARVVDADHGDMAGGVSRSPNRDDAPVLAQRMAAWERAERTVIERKGLRRKAPGQGLAQDAAHGAGKGGRGELQFGIEDSHRRGSVNNTVHMV